MSLFASVPVLSSEITADVAISRRSPSVLTVSGRFERPVRAFSFETGRAGAKGLDARVRDIELFDAAGKPVPHRKGPEGSFFCDREVVSFRYSLALAPPSDPLKGAHVSWMRPGTAVLFLADVLPIISEGARPVSVRFDVPEGWTLNAPLESSTEGRYEVPDAGKAVFLLSRTARTHLLKAGGSDVQISIEGVWQFRDAEAASTVEALLDRYEKIFDSRSFPLVRVIIVPVPIEGILDRWSAETRGNTVVILSSPSRYRNLGPQRLSEQLRHELLHLWLPNSLSLQGDYSWFYEGFAVYEALKTGALLGQIRFEDVLRTLAEAHRRTILGARDSQEPLLAMGRGRFEGEGVKFYSKALLVAFLCDVRMLGASKGRRGTEQLLRELFRDATDAREPESGTDAALRLLGRRSELRNIVNGYIKGTEVPEWSSVLAIAGLRERAGGGGERLGVVAHPTGRQRAILKRLGYNIDR